MYKGTAKAGGTGYSPKTGISAFKILAVNPTKEQISELIGRDYPLDVNYDLRDDLDGNKVRPIEFWVQSKETGIVDKITFQIGNTIRKSQNENVQVINAKGVSRFAPSVIEANLKYQNLAPFVREMFVGEDALYRFMHCAMGYKYSDPEANFLQDSKEVGITPENLYSNELGGLREFIDFVNSKNRYVGLVFAVKEKEKLDDNGNKITQNRQVILNNPDFFFTLASGKVEKYNTDRFLDVVKEKQSAGVSLGTALFTIELQDFVKEDCINNVPSNPSPQSSGWA